MEKLPCIAAPANATCDSYSEAALANDKLSGHDYSSKNLKAYAVNPRQPMWDYVNNKFINDATSADIFFPAMPWPPPAGRQPSTPMREYRKFTIHPQISGHPSQTRIIRFETYPFMFQLSDGRVIHVGGSEYTTDTEALDLNSQTRSVVDGRIIDEGSAAMYLPDKIMKAGSASDSQNSGRSSNTTFG